LPDVPIEDFNYSLVTNTILNNADLFKIVTPICADTLERLSKSHLNCKFVTSILCSFHEGFWPLASAEQLICKNKGHDNCHLNDVLNEDLLSFMHNQWILKSLLIGIHGCLDPSFSQEWSCNLVSQSQNLAW